MFDLFRSRDKAVRILLGALLLAVALSMLLYLVPGYGSSTGTQDDQVIAEIGKNTLTVRDVQRQIKDLTRNKQVPSQMLQAYVPQMIEGMLYDRAVAYQAERMGFQVSDAELANTLQSISNGQFSDPAIYQRFVAEQGMTIPEFEENVRQNALHLRLQNVILEGVVVTPEEIKQEFMQRNDKIKLDYILFSPTEMKSKVNPSAAELQDYFAKHRAGYVLPERRSVDLIVIDEAKVAESLQVPEDQLKQTYSANLDRFRTPERVKVRHILLKTTGKSPAEVAKIKVQAEDLLKQLKSGADFGELARRFSEDTTSAVKSGEVGWVSRGQTVKNFEDAAFSLQPHVLSSIITTEYGFHILQVEEKENARLRPFDEVKGELAAEIKKQEVIDRMQAVAESAHTELSKAPANAQAIAAKLNVRLVHADKIGPGEALPDIGKDATVTGAVGALKKGEVSQVLQSGPSKLVVAVVTDVLPPHQAEFNDVAARVRDQYVQEKATQLVTEMSQKGAEALKKNGGDLNAAAKSVGLTVKTTDEFTRRGAAEGIGSAQYLADLFNKPVGATAGPIQVPSQTILAKVVAKIPADSTKLPAERDTIVTQLKSKKSQERNQLFQDSVLTKLIQEGKIKIHRDVIRRLTASYAS